MTFVYTADDVCGNSTLPWEEQQHDISTLHKKFHDIVVSKAALLSEATAWAKCACACFARCALHSKVRPETTWWWTQVCNRIPVASWNVSLISFPPGSLISPCFCSARLCCVLSESHLHTFELPSFQASKLLSTLTTHLACTYLGEK